MNTLQDLNSRLLNISYTDARPASVIFDRNNATNSTKTIFEGEELVVEPGIEILDVSNYSVSAPYYEIDIHYITGATVTWDTIPTGCIVTNPSTGVYRISGVNSQNIWQQIRNPTISFPSNLFGEYTFTGKIGYNSGQSKVWTVSLTIIDVELLTQPTEFTYYSGVQNSVTGVPQIIDAGAGTPTYTLTITPSVTSVVSLLSTSGTGGTSSFNSTTKVLTLTGTRTQVNSRLSALKFTTPSTADLDLNFTYYITNNLNSETDTKIQLQRSYSSMFLGPVRNTITYNEDQSKSVSGGPLITDSIYADSTGYTLTIIPSPTTAVSTLSSSGTGGTSVWNNSSKTLTLTGTRAQINARIDALTLTPTPDYSSNFSLQYTVTTPRNISVSKSQSMLIGTTNIELINMDGDRSFTPGINGLIFTSDIPQITDTDTSGPTYTCTFSSVDGKFSYPTNWPSTPYTYSTLSPSISLTKTKTQWNSFFSTIKYQPNDGTYLNHTFTYTQYKSNLSTAQANKTVNMIGPDISFDREIATDGIVIVNENQTHDAYVGIQMYMNNYSAVLPEYTIDVSNLSGATVTWVSPLPTGVVTSNPSTGIYTISGFDTNEKWNQIKNPLISLPTNYTGHWEYTSTLTYSGSSTKVWSTNTIVRDIVNTNTSMISIPAYGSTYTGNTITKFTDWNPQITDTTSGTYSMEVYASGNTLAANSLTNYALSSINATHTVSGITNLLSGDGTILVSSNGTTYDIKQKVGNSWEIVDTIPNGTYISISDDGNTIINSSLESYEKSGSNWELHPRSGLPNLSSYTLNAAKLSGDGNTIALSLAYISSGEDIFLIFHKGAAGWEQDDCLLFVDIDGQPNYQITTHYELSYNGDVLAAYDDVSTTGSDKKSYIFRRSSYAWSLDETLTIKTVGISISGDGNTVAVKGTYTGAGAAIDIYRYSAFTGWTSELIGGENDTSTNITNVSLSYDGHMLIAQNTPNSKVYLYRRSSGSGSDSWTTIGYFARSNISNVKFCVDYQTILVQTTTNMYIYDSDYWPNWDTDTQSLKFSGTKTQVNSFLNLLIYVPYTGFTDNFTLVYIVTNPNGIKASATKLVELI